MKSYEKNGNYDKKSYETLIKALNECENLGKEQILKNNLAFYEIGDQLRKIGNILKDCYYKCKTCINGGTEQNQN